MLSSTMRFTPVSKNISKLLDIKSIKKMDTIAQYNPSPLTLQQFVDFGKSATEADSFNFLKMEVPIRLANIMKEINLLPSSLLQMPSIMLLQEWYACSFMELCAFEGKPDDRDNLKAFVSTLGTISKRHVNSVQTMAQGVLELKESQAVDIQTENSIQYFLDRFYMSRISTRMLTNQHAMLFGIDDGDDDYVPETRPNRIGLLDTECNVKSSVMEAFNSAAFLCEEYYFTAPDIDLIINNRIKPGEPIKLCYPPQHLYHALFELFKNAMRAVVENKPKGKFDLPDIRVLITQSETDITIRISDQGGGIPRIVTERLFHYLYSTAPRPSMQPTKAPLAGYGYGLPLSRLYARYFHGDLILNSYDGYGTDAVIYLRANTADAVELLPVFNKTSTKQYKLSVPAADWTDPASIMSRQILYAHATKA